MTDATNHPASYKDPAGFVFERDGIFYRHVNPSYKTAYERLTGSGLYALLTSRNRLIQHTEIDENLSRSQPFYKTLLPVQLPFISYAYEWSFDQLKDAALLTLQVCQEAIRHGMVLKDATPYNIQFVNSRAVFIDTLSFELYDPSQPWIAYRQFCEAFLAPLLLSHFAGTNLNALLLAYPEGIPISVCARLLPFKSKLHVPSLLHIHLQSRVTTGTSSIRPVQAFSQQKLVNILEHLAKGIESLHAGSGKTTWSDYYQQTIKSQQYLEEKQTVFNRLLEQTAAETAIDLGANTGVFSRLLSAQCKQVVACDFDSRAINQLYLGLKAEPQPILPLVVDLSHPSPAIGWANRERAAFLQRSRFDLVVALALIHHLVIGKNIPLQQLAACFQGMCKKFLLIEFVEREDEKVKVLLQRKQLDYAHYNKGEFEQQLAVYFEPVAHHVLSDGMRILYLWKKRGLS